MRPPLIGPEAQNELGSSPAQTNFRHRPNLELIPTHRISTCYQSLTERIMSQKSSIRYIPNWAQAKSSSISKKNPSQISHVGQFINIFTNQENGLLQSTHLIKFRPRNFRDLIYRKSGSYFH